jgi:hypothetical protein
MKRLALGLLAGWLIAVGVKGETRTFAEIAGAGMLEQAKLTAEVLAKIGLLPAERVESMEVDDLRWEVEPRGKVRGVVCDYEFSGGRLQIVRRRDLVTVTNGYAPIMDHKTNSVLAMTTKEAEAKAFEILTALGFDEGELRREWKIRVESRHLDRSLIGGLPREVNRTFLSRHPIELSVRLKKKGDRDRFGGLELEFLGTTGELLSVQLWDDRLLTRSGPFAQKIRVEAAADFNPPLFFSVVREFKARKRTEKEVAEFVKSMWDELGEKVRARKPALYVVYADLAHPEVVAAEISKRAGDVPWTGTSEDRDRRIRKQGLAVVAVCGRINTQVEIVPSVRDAEAWKAGVDVAVKKLGISGEPPRHAVWILGPYGEPSKKLHNALKSDHRVLPLGVIRSGAVFFNGAVRREGQVLIRASGMHREGENWTGVPIELMRYEPLRNAATDLGMLVGRLQEVFINSSGN